MPETVVWLPAYHRYAILGQRNAYYSVVYWDDEGQRFEVELENDEYEIVGDNDDDDDE